ncbi:MAG: hypothetical protein HC903_19570 [Methylacidiphilales bacterium]|nr:hypothetical protein [Candidatus Methylacidiphilales bacterium]NJR16456.1 hypothetical protein [Calothrix sp. CSU_2_0]
MPRKANVIFCKNKVVPMADEKSQYKNKSQKVNTDVVEISKGFSPELLRLCAT